MSKPSLLPVPALALLGTALALAAATTAGAWAADHPQRSLYTTIRLAECAAAKPSPSQARIAGKAWSCSGLAGYPVHVAVAGGHTLLSVGPEPERRRAASQTLASPATPVDAHSGRITIEWRFARSQGVVRPYATIVRFFTTPAGAKGELLVVSRVADDDTCHVAYIDALAHPFAIVTARAIADGEARSFDCRSEPRTIGGRD
jgi:hypothetical protein